MPARIRKKNPMYFDDEALLTSPNKARGSPRKGGKSSGSVSNTPKKQGRDASPEDSNSRGSSPAKSVSLSQHHHHLRHHHSSLSSSNISTSVVPPQRRTEQLQRVLSPPIHSTDSSSRSSSSVPHSHHHKQPTVKLERTIELDHKTIIHHDLEPPNMMQLNLSGSSSSNDSSNNAVVNTAVFVSSSVKSNRLENRPAIQLNGVRLRNFLKLPQAHKWIYYEWFYANIDQPLFLGRNDFEQVLREAFPQLKTRSVTRRQWSLIRRIMGKPRRCSKAFFSEEIASLAKRRQVLRLLQQRKITDVAQLRDLPFTLPHHIPCQLVIGTKVTARIRYPENGLYMGRVDAVDTSNNTYRVTFVRNGIGTHSIPDHEVLSCEAPEMVPLASFQQKFRPRPPLGLVTPPRPILPRTLSGNETPNKAQQFGLDSPHYITNDPVLAQSPRHLHSTVTVGDTIGQYSVESLMHIVQLWKLLESKVEKVKQLENLNSSAEKLRCTGDEVTAAFQRKYATLVLDVDRLNEQLNTELLHVHSFCQDISGGSCAAAAPRLLPRQIQERCMAEAVAVVQVSNSSAPEAVTDDHALHLVTSLTAVMLQIKNLGENEVSAFELSALQSTLNNLREEVEDKKAFRDLIDVPLTHIMAAASQLGPLNAFTTVANN
uniref:Protein lin-9 homolog n=1 Tax=Hirondellea gigas TaxID=1518452 RepID=A0A6A7G3S1_9CRUS